MSKIKAVKVLNSVTDQEELHISGCTLKRVSDTVLQLNNDNQTNYQVADVTLPNGEVRSAIFYSGMADSLAEGDQVKLRIIQNEDGKDPLVIVGYDSTQRLTNSDLAAMFDVEEVSATATAEEAGM